MTTRGGLVEGEGEEAMRAGGLRGSAEAAEGAPRAALPSDATGSEEDGVNRRHVVVLGVQGQHAHEEQEIGQTEPSPRCAAEKKDEAGQPEEDVEGVECLDLLVEKGEWREDGVLAAATIVLQELERGPVVMDLPEEVGAGDQEHEGNAGEGFAAEKQRSADARGEECEAERDQKEGHGRLVEQAEAGSETEAEPGGETLPGGMGGRQGNGVRRGVPWRGRGEAEVMLEREQGEQAAHPEEGLEGVHGEEAVDAEVLRGDEDAEHGEGPARRGDRRGTRRAGR